MEMWVNNDDGTNCILGKFVFKEGISQRPLSDQNSPQPKNNRQPGCDYYEVPRPFHQAQQPPGQLLQDKQPHRA